MSDRIDWAGIAWEARGFLGLENDEPIPRDELVATARANGWSKREVQEGLRETDALEADGDDLDYVRLTSSEADEPESEPADTVTGANSADTVSREDAVEALRDVLRFYHARLDDTIADHTEGGSHPERPTTAREYFEDVRGWESETVDELRLGWAPADHVDELVAYLFDRGHDREAMLATGAIGESDSGSLYTTFKGRYVLPYYDAAGDPAYAIARVTGGDGGGAKGYGGHPADYQAGKYAKLRHTDDRVPLDEPIYGLDTLDHDDHVVIAEGIADAITAREHGVAVLSPVAKEFKKAHFDPLADALEEHGARRVTVVADADNAWDGERDADTPLPETIGGAAAESLADVPAGEGGALRTAAGLTERAPDVDVRVAMPPAPAGVENDLDEYVTEWNGDLWALLRSARPPEDYSTYEDAVGDQKRDAASAFDDFDPDTYEPAATASGETTTDVRDIFAALDRLDARQVAERTIVREWLDDRGDRRTFAPTWAPAGYTGTANFVDRDGWADTGGRGGSGRPAEMAAIDAGLVRDTECPRAVKGETWWKAVDHLRDLGFPIPEYQPENDEDEADDSRNLLGLDVVVEPANALEAASAVTPEDLTDPDALPELARDDVDDVAIAVALQEGWITAPDQFPADGRYTEAYYLARDRYGAPLPKYLDNTTLEERADLAMAAVDRITPEHILDTCESTVTVDDPSGTATAKLDPTWEDSESGERIIAGYGRGFWCAKHSPGQPEGNRTFDALQLVALEHGLIENEFVRPRGEAYKQAYRLLREEYGAPLPKWRATILEHRAVLPPAVRLLDDDHRATPAESLADARAETEALVRDAVTVRDRAQLLTVVPGGGKTYSAAVVADEKPILYVASRNELKDQMEAYVHEIHADDETHPDAEPTCMHLPILAENQLGDAAIEAGVGAVREHGRDLLRDRDALLEHVTEYIEETEDAEETDADGEDIDLDRASCATAEGDYSRAWRVAVQVARALGHRPADLHTNAEALFGEELPCRHETGECEYTAAWEAARDPDNPKDVLIGSPGHAFVDSATTYFERRGNERVERPRAVVVDEFPGETFATDYGDRFMDHAVWLANALRGVQTREDLGAADLADDTWINAWLNGEGADYAPAADAKEVFTALASIADATTEAHTLLDGQLLADVDADTNVDIERLRGLLQDLVDATPGGDVLHDVQDGVRDILDDVEGRAHHRYTNGRDAGALYALRDRLEDILGSLAEGHAGFDDRDPLAAASAAVDALPASGDLEHLLRNAIGAVGTRAAKPLLEAALTALDGGRDGCRALAIHATDGYAHPTAWALLAGAIADTEHGNATDVALDTFSLDEERDGGHFKRLTKNDATIAVDKNHHGAIVVDTPAFTDITGSKCAVLGLDATGRTDLWRLAIGRDTQRRDIHDTDAERRRFLRETMNLTVVQTTDRPLPYHGKPDGKNFQEDLELVRTVANEYTGTHPEAFDDKGPAVISTLKVLNHLEDDLADHAGDTVNYENMKGSDALGDHQVAVILGSQHYGDAAPEKWALLAGQDAGRGDTRGPTLDYGSDIANAYLHHMREDHTMQAILRAGRNADASVVFAHTSALRDDLPVDDQGAVVSAHSRGTLAVVDAARDLRGRTFTARDIATAIDDVGLRQVQNVLADLRDGGYLRVDTQGSRGRAYEYELGDDDPGLADVDLPELEGGTGSGENEISGSSTEYTWNFVFESDGQPDAGVTPPSRATIPVSDTVDAAAPPT